MGSQRIRHDWNNLARTHSLSQRRNYSPFTGPRHLQLLWPALPSLVFVNTPPYLLDKVWGVCCTPGEMDKIFIQKLGRRLGWSSLWMKAHSEILVAFVRGTELRGNRQTVWHEAADKQGSKFRPQLGKAPQFPVFVLFLQHCLEIKVCWYWLEAEAPTLSPLESARGQVWYSGCPDSQAASLALASSIPGQPVSLMERKQPKPASCLNSSALAESPKEVHPFELPYGVPSSCQMLGSFWSHCSLFHHS